MRLIPFLFLALPLSLFSQNTLSIEVSGVRNSEGQIMVAVYNSNDSFLSKDKVYKAGKTSATEGATKLSIDIPDGEYALAVFHDENANNELDTNWLGIPKEDVGFSIAKMKTFGPPRYKECKFRVEGGVADVQVFL